ncbi:MAG: hypothetical protein ABI999_03780 [Acidobacteriota bacterium]
MDLLSRQKRYYDFRKDLLRDPRYFDVKNIIVHFKSAPDAETVYKEFRRLGEKKESSCYVVSRDLDLDGQTMNLKEALLKIAGTQSESLIYCPVSKLGYFEGHEGWRYVLGAKSK